jgi:hypothetical protein
VRRSAMVRRASLSFPSPTILGEPFMALYSGVVNAFATGRILAAFMMRPMIVRNRFSGTLFSLVAVGFR